MFWILGVPLTFDLLFSYLILLLPGYRGDARDGWLGGALRYYRRHLRAADDRIKDSIIGHLLLFCTARTLSFCFSSLRTGAGFKRFIPNVRL